MTSQTISERRATRLYSRAAWIVSAQILLGFALYVPAASSALAQVNESSVGRAALATVLLGAAIATLTLWGAAMWYVRVSSEVFVSRPLLLAVLLLTHVVGAFVYYWCAVHWRSGTHTALRSSRPTGASAQAV